MRKSQSKIPKMKRTLLLQRKTNRKMMRSKKRARE
jgi:hypothetical protein